MRTDRAGSRMGQQSQGCGAGPIPARLIMGEAYTQEKRTAARMAAVTPAIERVDGQQVFRAVGFLR